MSFREIYKMKLYRFSRTFSNSYCFVQHKFNKVPRRYWTSVGSYVEQVFQRKWTTFPRFSAVVANLTFEFEASKTAIGEKRAPFISVDKRRKYFCKLLRLLAGHTCHGPPAKFTFNYTFLGKRAFWAKLMARYRVLLHFRQTWQGRSKWRGRFVRKLHITLRSGKLGTKWDEVYGGEHDTYPECQVNMKNEDVNELGTRALTSSPLRSHSACGTYTVTNWPMCQLVRWYVSSAVI